MRTIPNKLLVYRPCYIETDIVRTEPVRPVRPDKFAWVDEVGDDDSETSMAVRGLRDAPEGQYEWFCENFMQCVIPTAEWKLVCRRKLMSDYVTPALEAFAILVYMNAYDKWNEEFAGTSCDEDSLTTSTSSGARRGFLYTGDAKGSRKYEGWNEAGMTYYNKLLVVINQQRGRIGNTFDRDLLKIMSLKSKRGAKKGEREAPRVNNNIDMLKNMVGV